MYPPGSKRDGNSKFDVTMSSFDGAETCELIGLYMLSQLQHLDINIGLYRDDGLAACHKTPRQVEVLKKKICAIFTKNNLRIRIDANKKSINFLDITLDLATGTYSPYMKPNNTPLYVHKDSNHPPSVINNIPESINKWLSNISSNQNIFEDATNIYQEALDKSGYDYNLNFNPRGATHMLVCVVIIKQAFKFHPLNTDLEPGAGENSNPNHGPACEMGTLFTDQLHSGTPFTDQLHLAHLDTLFTDLH